MTEALPVCSSKLSIVGLGKYYGGDRVGILSVRLFVPSLSASSHCPRQRNVYDPFY